MNKTSHFPVPLPPTLVPTEVKGAQQTSAFLHQVEVQTITVFSILLVLTDDTNSPVVTESTVSAVDQGTISPVVVGDIETASFAPDGISPHLLLKVPQKPLPCGVLNLSPPSPS